MSKTDKESYYLRYFDDKINENFLRFNCLEKVKAYLESMVVGEEDIYSPCVFKGNHIDFDCEKYMDDFYESNKVNVDE